jgi:ketosteroid isomerase-like protein
MRLHPVLMTSLLFPLAMTGGCSGSIDLEAEREALLQADRDFDMDTAERGGDGWADAFREDGVMYPKKGKVEGREAIRELMTPVFEGEVKLRWEPVYAEVGSGGDLGYTLGKWKQIARTEAGEDTVLSTGNYVSIWRKVPGEGWKVAVDLGNDD